MTCAKVAARRRTPLPLRVPLRLRFKRQHITDARHITCKRNRAVLQHSALAP